MGALGGRVLVRRCIPGVLRLVVGVSHVSRTSTKGRLLHSLLNKALSGLWSVEK